MGADVPCRPAPARARSGHQGVDGVDLEKKSRESQNVTTEGQRK